jgi:hypothetical protein
MARTQGQVWSLSCELEGREGRVQLQEVQKCILNEQYYSQLFPLAVAKIVSP